MSIYEDLKNVLSKESNQTETLKNVKVPLNTANSITKTIEEPTNAISLLSQHILPENMRSSDYENQIKQLQLDNELTANPTTEFLTNIPLGFGSEYAIRQPLSLTLKKVTERIVTKKLPSLLDKTAKLMLDSETKRSIASGTGSTVGESFAWSLPYSVEPTRGGKDVEINSKALASGSIANTAFAGSFALASKGLKPAKVTVNIAKNITKKTASRIIDKFPSIKEKIEKIKQAREKRAFGNKDMIDFDNNGKATYTKFTLPEEVGSKEELFKDLKSYPNSFLEKTKYILMQNKDTFFDDIKIDKNQPTGGETIKDGDRIILSINPDKIKNSDDLIDILDHEGTHNKTFEDSNIEPTDTLLHEFTAYSSNIIRDIKNGKIDKAKEKLNLFKQYSDKAEQFGYSREDGQGLYNLLDLYIKEPTEKNKNKITGLLSDINKALGSQKDMVDFIDGKPKHINVELTEYDKKIRAKEFRQALKTGNTKHIKETLEDILDTDIPNFTLGSKTEYKNGKLTISKNSNLKTIVRRLDDIITTLKTNKKYGNDNIVSFVNRVFNKKEPARADKKTLSKLNNDITDMQEGKLNIDKEEINSKVYRNYEEMVRTNDFYKEYKKLSDEDIIDVYYTIKDFIEGKTDINKDKLIKALHIYEIHRKMRKFEKEEPMRVGSNDLKDSDPFENDILKQVLDKDYPYMDEKDKSTLVTLGREEGNAVNPKIDKKKLYNSFMKKLNAFIFNDTDEVGLTLREKLKHRITEFYKEELKRKNKNLTNQQIENIVKKDQKKIEEIVKTGVQKHLNKIKDEFKERPSEFAYFKVEPTGEVVIDKLNVSRLEKDIDTLKPQQALKDEKLLSKLERKESKVAKNLEEELGVNKKEYKEKVENFIKKELTEFYKNSVIAMKKKLKNSDDSFERIKRITGIETIEDLKKMFSKLASDLRNNKVLLSAILKDPVDFYTTGRNVLIDKNKVLDIFKKYNKDKIKKEPPMGKKPTTISRGSNKKPSEKAKSIREKIQKEKEELIKKQRQEERKRRQKELNRKKELNKEKESSKENEIDNKNKFDKKENKPKEEKPNKENKTSNKSESNKKEESDGGGGLKELADKLKESGNEYINKRYDLKTVLTNNVKKKLRETYYKIPSAITFFKASKWKKIKYNESIAYESLKNNIEKYGTTDMKKLTEVAGGSEDIHLLALIHETIHNIKPDFSEERVIQYTNLLMYKMLKDFPELKERWDIRKEFEDFLKLYMKKQRIKESEKESLRNTYTMLLGFTYVNKDLKDILFGSQSLWKRVEILENKFKENILNRLYNEIKSTELYKKAKDYIEKDMPTAVKEVLFEANILEPTESVKKLQELKERFLNGTNLFKSAGSKLIKKLEADYSKDELKVITKSGLLQLRTIIKDLRGKEISTEELINLIKSDEYKLSKLNETQKYFIKHSTEFKFTDGTKAKEKVFSYDTFRKNQRKIGLYFDNFALFRARYILEKNGLLNKLDKESLKQFIDYYNEFSSEVINTESLILGYEPYIIKGLNRLRFAFSEEERVELRNKGYKEASEGLFVVPHNEEEFVSQLTISKSFRRRTGLNRIFNTNSNEYKDFIQSDLYKKNKDRLVFLHKDKDIIEVLYIPEKIHFKEIYFESEPIEVLHQMLGSVIDKAMFKKLIKDRVYKDSLKDIISFEKEKGFVKATKEQQVLLESIFQDEINDLRILKGKDVKVQFYVDKTYKNMLLYKHFEFKDEKLNTIYQIYTSLIKRLKGNATYKSATAFTSAIFSGITGLVSLGVNPKYVPKLITQTVKEWKEWQKFENKFNEILYKQGYNEAREYLRTVKKNNVFAEIFYDGKIGNLSSDIEILFGSTKDEKALYQGLKSLDKKYGINNADKIIKMIKTGLLDKETIIGQYLINYYSNIDLFTRASAYKYLKVNYGKEKAIEMINNLFVDFKKEPIGWIRDIENSGIPFLVFMLRMQGGIIKTAKEKPLTMAMIVGMYFALADERNDDYSKNGIRIDSWFLHRTLMDPLTFKLSVYNQIIHGHIFKEAEQMILPKEYLLIYKAIQKQEPTEVIGIYTK